MSDLSPGEGVSEMRAGAVIVAAGRGVRAGGETPKQWREIAGRPMVDHTVAAFEGAPGIGPVVLVIHPEDAERAAAYRNRGLTVVDGGADRAASVRAGLDTLAEDVTHVLVHDAARPCVTGDLIARVIDALENSQAAAPAVALTDALWTGEDARVTGIRDRNGLYRAQTPQGFALSAIRAAHAAHPGASADDVEVARAAGLDVAIVPGDPDNLKVTHPADFARAERILGGPRPMRLGNGYDVHRFGPGDHVMLCGVRVPHDRGLQGHSDADVGMHAVTDAILGALAEGDIGRHFPPSDPQWKGAASEIFLAHAGELARARGYAVGNIDLTLICERPKIGPHAGEMQECLARILGVPPDRISVKATTSEGLGFTGRGEGIAAQATALMVPA